MPRTYGWAADHSIIDAEATVIRDAAAAVIDGEPAKRITARLNDAGITAARGGPWTSVSLVRLLKNPRMVGERRVGRTLVADVPPILDRDTWDQVTAILTDPERRKFVPSHPDQLLAGILWCEHCGQLMTYARGPGAYRAPCSRSISAPDVEREVTVEVLARATSPAWLSAVAAATERGTEHYAALIDGADERLAVISETFGRGGSEKAAFDAGVAAARQARADAEASLEAISVGERIGLTDRDVVAWWSAESTTVDDRRELIRLVLPRVGVRPASEVEPGTRAERTRDRIVYY